MEKVEKIEVEKEEKVWPTIVGTCLSVLLFVLIWWALSSYKTSIVNQAVEVTKNNIKSEFIARKNLCGNAMQAQRKPNLEEKLSLNTYYFTHDYEMTKISLENLNYHLRNINSRFTVADDTAKTTNKEINMLEQYIDCINNI